MNNVGFLVLAAGLAERFGGDKLLTPLPPCRDQHAHTTNTVIEATLANLPASYPKHVVCRPSQTRLIDLLTQLPVSYSCNERLADGMGYSIAYGVSQTIHWRGWIICLADMPWVQTNTYCTIAEQLALHPVVAPVIASQSDTSTWQQGNPIGFSHQFKQDLLILSGKSGGRSILQANHEKVYKLKVKDKGILLDIDYPDDINRHQ